MVYLFFALLALIALAACSITATHTVEVTRLVPQTVLVTVVTTPVPSVSVSQTSDSENTVYFEGMIVIAEYYKLLDQALYEHAYQLLGASAKQHSPNLEDYVASSTRAYKSVKIVGIQPYDEWIKQQGHEPSPDPELKNTFYVQIIAEGEGVMSGSAVSGEVQTLFITVVQEDGQWRIDSFSTGLAP